MVRVKPVGYYSLRLRKKNGNVILQKGKNLIVTSGLELIASLVNGSGDKPAYVAIGDDDSAVDLAQTALQGTEHLRQLGAVTVTGALYSIFETLTPPGVSVAVAEMGIFNAVAPGGTMVSRWLPSAFDFSPGDELDVEWMMEFS